MNDYISREKLIEALAADYNNEWDGSQASEEYVEGVRDEYDDVLTIICRMKGTDAQPVRRGRWLEHRATWIDQPKMEGWFVQAKCSECGICAPVLNRYTKTVAYEYCPHCGARMGLDNDMRNLTDEETDIYNSRLEAEAKTIDEIFLL